MEPQTTRERILSVLQGIAPEADVRAIVADRPLREQIDLDSMDWLNLTDQVGERLGVMLPATRLGPQATLDDWVQAVRTARPARRARGTRRGRRPRAEGRPVSVRRLADGRRVRLRPVVAADAPRLAEFIRGLSPTTLYRRFMVTLRELPPHKLKYFTAVDQRRHIALAATQVGTGRREWIGVVRCIADAQGDDCEFALTVGDEWQGTGLAGVLMRALMAAARARGLRTMHGDVLHINGPMLTLARQLGFAVQRMPDDPGTLRVSRAL